MRLSRKLIIPAIAASALMVVAPTAALASTSSAATPAAVTLSASRNMPAGEGYHWAYYNSYNTLTQCQDTGQNILWNNGWNWKCVQTEGYGGYDWEYDLYIWIG
jgi:hypothetical protein